MKFYAAPSVHLNPGPAAPETPLPGKWRQKEAWGLMSNQSSFTFTKRPGLNIGEEKLKETSDVISVLHMHSTCLDPTHVHKHTHTQRKLT